MEDYIEYCFECKCNGEIPISYEIWVSNSGIPELVSKSAVKYYNAGEKIVMMEVTQNRCKDVIYTNTSLNTERVKIFGLNGNDSAMICGIYY